MLCNHNCMKLFTKTEANSERELMVTQARYMFHITYSF